MQGLALKTGQRPAAIEFIGQQGVAQMQQVDSDLVGAAGVQLAVHKTGLRLAGQQAHVGACGLARLAVQVNHRHAGALARIAPDGLINLHRSSGQPGLVGHGQVFALDLALGNGADQGVHDRPRFGHDHQAAGVFVEPVHNAGPRQQSGLLMVGQQAIEQSPAPVTRGGVNHQTGRLVDHQQVFVLIRHGQIHGLALKSLALRRRAQLDAQKVTNADLARRTGDNLRIDLHRTGLDQLLQIVAGEFGGQASQRPIEPLAVLLSGCAGLAPLAERFERQLVRLFGPRRLCRGSGFYNFGALSQADPHWVNQKVNSMVFAGLSTARIATLAAVLAMAGCASDPKDPTVGWSPNKIYSEARDEAASGAYDKAVSLFEKLEGRAAGTPLAQQAQLEKAHAHYRAGEPAQATATLDRFMRLHPSSPAMDYALYLKGLVNFNDNLGLLGRLARKDLSESDQKAAKESFESFKELANRYPESKYSADARQRMGYIVNSLAQSEVNVARYYHSRGAHVAAINRAQTAIQEFRDVPAVEEAMFILYRSYDALGMNDLRDDTLRVMRRTYPNSAYLGQAGPGSNKRAWYRFW